MSDEIPAPSARRTELLELAYGYVLRHGLSDVSLRPLATAIGSSPRVLLYLFVSKDELVRALLARARADELDFLAKVGKGGGLMTTAQAIWSWLAAPEHSALLTLWVQAYSHSLMDPDGPWAGFAVATVQDWLDVLAAAQPTDQRRSSAGLAQRTLTLAVLRGGLLDLLATGDVRRTTQAVRAHLQRIGE